MCGICDWCVVLPCVRPDATYCSLRCISFSRSYYMSPAPAPCIIQVATHFYHYGMTNHSTRSITKLHANTTFCTPTPTCYHRRHTITTFSPPHITSTPHPWNIDTSLPPHCTFSHSTQPIYQTHLNTDANHTNHTNTLMRST